MRLNEVIRPLSGLHCPDLWEEITSRELNPRPEPQASSSLRLVAAIAGLLIGGGGVLIVVRAFETPNSLAHADTIPTGIIAYSEGSSGGLQVAVMSSDGTGKISLTGTGPASSSNPFPAWDPAWSPSGSQLAFRGYWGDGEFSDLFVMDSDGTNIRQLTTRMSGSGPSWSPEGDKIAFAGYDGIYTVNPDGSGLRRITTGGQEYGFPTWSPDGNNIAFSMSQGGSLQIFVMTAAGEQRRALTTLLYGAEAPDWSPDGSRIVFEGNVVTTPSIFSMRSDGGDVLQLTTCEPTSCNGDTFPAWLPDGSAISFSRNQDIFLIHSDGSGLTQLTFDQAGYERPSWRP